MSDSREIYALANASEIGKTKEEIEQIRKARRMLLIAMFVISVLTMIALVTVYATMGGLLSGGIEIALPIFIIYFIVTGTIQAVSTVMYMKAKQKEGKILEKQVEQLQERVRMNGIEIDNENKNLSELTSKRKNLHKLFIGIAVTFGILFVVALVVLFTFSTVGASLPAVIIPLLIITGAIGTVGMGSLTLAKWGMEDLDEKMNKDIEKQTEKLEQEIENKQNMQREKTTDLQQEGEELTQSLPDNTADLNVGGVKAVSDVDLLETDPVVGTSAATKPLKSATEGVNNANNKDQTSAVDLINTDSGQLPARSLPKRSNSVR